MIPNRTTARLKVAQMRENRRMSQRILGELSGVGKSWVGRFERGETEQPQYNRLSAILDALNDKQPIPIQDREWIMASFRFGDQYPIPSKSEIAVAQDEWENSYANIPYPAYYVDCSQRLLDFNVFAPKLVGLTKGDPRTKDFENITIFDLLFNVAPKYVEIVNPAEYVPDLIRSMKTQELRYRSESWYDSYIENVKEKYPGFAIMWDSVAYDELNPLSLGNNIPIQLAVPSAGLLTFRLVPISFNADPRFQVVQWIPMDLKSMLQCVTWVLEEDNNQA